MKYFIAFILTCSAAFAHAQTIKGSVIDATNKQALPGASVVWQNTTNGAIADANGLFEIAYPAKTPAVLVVTYIGYISDSITFNNQTELLIKLKPSSTLNDVEVVGTKEATTFST